MYDTTSATKNLFDRVTVDQAHGADAGAHEQLGLNAAKAAATHDHHARPHEVCLTLRAERREQYLSRVSGRDVGHGAMVSAGGVSELHALGLSPILQTVLHSVNNASSHQAGGPRGLL